MDAAGLPCRLYLTVEGELPGALPGLLESGIVAALLLNANDPGQPAWKRLVDAVRPAAHAHDVALILAGRADLAARLGCDGAHVALEEVAAARRALGDLQLGTSCGMSRDAAMQAGEDGADYVAFAVDDEAGDLLAWWSELMELPAVAEGAAITPETCGPLVSAGAEFLLVGDAVWRHAGGPEEAIRAFAAAIAAHAPVRAA